KKVAPTPAPMRSDPAMTAAATGLFMRPTVGRLPVSQPRISADLAWKALFGSARRHDHHRTRRLVSDRVRDAAEHAAGSVHALAADDDQVSRLIRGHRQDGRRRCLRTAVGLHGNTIAVDLRREALELFLDLCVDL